MNFKTENKKKATIGITTTATLSIMLVASIGLLPQQTAEAGFTLVNCDTELRDGFLLKCYDSTDPCFDGLEIAASGPQLCHFVIDYLSATPANVVDHVPAEWEVVSTFTEFLGCDTPGGEPIITQANKGKKANKSATIITCPNVQDAKIHVWMETRESPSTVKNDNKEDKFKPTSCDPEFGINDGAQALDLVLVDAFGDPIVLFETDSITTPTDPNDLDCDGIPDTG